VLMTTLAMSGGDSFSVIESLRCVEGDTPVIAWAEDRELREYATSQLAHTRAKVLGRAISAVLCQRCVEALLPQGHKAKSSSDSDAVEFDEQWVELAERARERFGVAGAAAYTKERGTAEYRLSASWSPDAPMSNVPGFLTSALEEVIATGVERMWTDLVDVALRSLAIVPILRDHETAGALCVFDSKPHALCQDDLETLRAMAGGSAGGSAPRRGVPAVPMGRNDADAIIKRELARAGRKQRPLSVLLFAMTEQRADTAPPVDDILATVIRGNDLIVRWTTSEVVVVLADADNGIAERVAERINDIVRTKAAVAELATTESFDDTIARAAASIRTFPSGSPCGEVPRNAVSSRGATARRTRRT